VSTTNDAVATTVSDYTCSGYHDFISYHLLTDGGLKFYEYPLVAPQFIIESIHFYTGLPWWGSIITSVILLRLLLIPLHYKNVKVVANLTEQSKVYNEKLKESKERILTFEEQKDLQRDGLQMAASLWSMFKNMFKQIPFFVCMFLGLRRMCLDPVWKEQLLTGGTWWFTDLTSMDSLYIFPVLCGINLLLTISAPYFVRGVPILNPIVLFILGSFSTLVCA